MPLQITPLRMQPRQALVDHYARLWETAHLPLSKANINTSHLGQNVGLGEG